MTESIYERASKVYGDGLHRLKNPRRWDLFLSKDQTGSVECVGEQVVLRVDSLIGNQCDVTLSRAATVHLASALREAAMDGSAKQAAMEKARYRRRSPPEFKRRRQEGVRPQESQVVEQKTVQTVVDGPSLKLISDWEFLHTGKRSSPASISRWIHDGLCGVRLVGSWVGGRWLCTSEQFLEFMTACSAAKLSARTGKSA